MTKKALFLAGGWDGHEPQETSRFISNEIEKIDDELLENYNHYTKAMMEHYLFLIRNNLTVEQYLNSLN